MTGYREAGVDLEGAERHVASIGPLVTSTWGESVVGGFGGFAAGIEIPSGYRNPILMMSTDGVGTKLEIARRAQHYDGVGFDLVAMCVDDLAAVGARPLGFVDYLAVGSLDPERDTALVASIASACRLAGCALLGGETAEHPGVMDRDAIDLAGAVMGVVERGSEIDGSEVRPADVIVGISSPNLRSNGFSLVRSVLRDTDLASSFPGGDRSWAETLLEPSVIYCPAILEVAPEVKAAAHITGGGLPGNLLRAVPGGMGAILDTGAWMEPEVFAVLRRIGDLDEATMRSTFNLGIGFCLVVDPLDADGVVARLLGAGHTATVIGEIVAGDKRVDFS